MRFYRVVALLIIGLLAACASNVTVNSDYRERVDFSQYKTYRWQEADNVNTSADALLSSDFVDKRIRDNVDSQLRSKGFSYREQAPVDFLISYHVSSERRENLSVMAAIMMVFIPGGVSGLFTVIIVWVMVSVCVAHPVWMWFITSKAYWFWI